MWRSNSLPGRSRRASFATVSSTSIWGPTAIARTWWRSNITTTESSATAAAGRPWSWTGLKGNGWILHLNRILQNGSRFPNGAFCQKWISLVRDLDRRGIAHGDLQSGNVLVLPNGGLKLVDYDGMYVPAMNRVLSETPELGLPAYQHPKRVRDFFDQRLDHFSALVILATFACLDAELWRRFNGGNDDQCLLFRAADFRAPEQSELMNLLLRSADPAVRKLAVLLKAACQGGLADVPPFSAVARDSVVARATDPAWVPAPGQRAGTRTPPPPPPQPPPPPPPAPQCARCGRLLDRSESNLWQCPACDRPPAPPPNFQPPVEPTPPVQPPWQPPPISQPQPSKSSPFLGVAVLAVIAFISYAYCSSHHRRRPLSYSSQPVEETCTPRGPCDPPGPSPIGLHAADECGPDGRWYKPGELPPRKDWAPDDPDNPCKH